MKKVFNDPILFSTIVFILIILIMFILFPMYNILKESFTYKGEFSLIHYKNIKAMQENFIIILNTLKLGVVTSLISTAIGFFFAYGMTWISEITQKIGGNILINKK